MSSFVHERSVPLTLLLGSAALAGLLAFMPEPGREEPVREHIPAPTISPGNAHQRADAGIRVRSHDGGPFLLAVQANGPFRRVEQEQVVLTGGDHRAAERITSIPLSLNWHHPVPCLPAAQVLHFKGMDADGHVGPERIHTILFADHGSLPVLSLVTPDAALFDPDTGILVVGNGIFHATNKVLTAEYRDPKWWKYPGNFHMRGKEWERKARIQFIDAEGVEEFQTEVALRVNGQMTRSFPQHALRFGFDEPLRSPVFGEDPGKGYKGLVLRSAGNDQIKAMLRDAFMHGLCQDLPFEVSAARTCVVYVNGAYWGVHHLRHRMDDKELARRYGIPSKRITILEDEARLYRGDTMEVVHFELLAKRTAAWDGAEPGWRRTVEAQLDIDGFFAYMATQMILGNVDWPMQNVKFWRYSGEPAQGVLDGRWHFIMGDCDLAYGVYGSATTDMFARVKAVDVPLTKLFHGLVKAPDLRARFVQIARDLATDEFSASRANERLEELVSSMAPEMARHTARWGRPGTVDAWEREVDVLRTFAKEREAHVLKQLDTFAHP